MRGYIGIMEIKESGKYYNGLYRFFFSDTWGYIGIMENKPNGNYYLGFRLQGFVIPSPNSTAPTAKMNLCETFRDSTSIS